DALKCIILGDRAAARKNYQAAMGQYDKAAGMSLPEEVLASVSKKRATTLHRLGKDEMAREALEQALDHDPDDAEARALLLRLKMPSPTPFGRPGDGEVVVKPVDPKKYGKEPKAMPAPKKPAVVEEPAKVEPPAEVGPAKVEPVKPPADKPDVVEDPGKAADEPEVKDDPAEVPEEKEKEKEEPAGKKKPKKRMAGPM
ncbi:MAG: tetratricopeptide repeat protein, partial [Planctomycetota bacterium]